MVLKEQYMPLPDLTKPGMSGDSPKENFSDKTAKSQSQKGCKISDIQMLQSEKYEINNISTDQAKKQPRLLIKVATSTDSRRPQPTQHRN